MLLVKNADPNIQDKMGMPPLLHASVHNHVAVVKLLLEHGADRNIKDNKGKTALDWAKQSKRKVVVKLLEGGPAPATARNAAPKRPSPVSAAKGRSSSIGRGWGKKTRINVIMKPKVPRL